MWKVGGTKIEHSWARYIFLPLGHVNLRKSDFLGKTLRTQKFSTGNFFGAGIHRILTHSGFRKCSWFGWPSLRFELTAAQIEVIGQKPVVLQKIRGVTKTSNLFFFSPIALKRIEHGVLVSEPMFYSFQSNRTKNKKVLIFRYTKFASRQISKWGSTSAARNLALKTSYPPLPYIIWSVWTRGFTRYHPKYTIPIQKIEQIAIQ